jgi:hypothetical protein
LTANYANEREFFQTGSPDHLDEISHKKPRKRKQAALGSVPSPTEQPGPGNTRQKQTGLLLEAFPGLPVFFHPVHAVTCPAKP